MSIEMMGVRTPIKPVSMSTGVNWRPDYYEHDDEEYPVSVWAFTWEDNDLRVRQVEVAGTAAKLTRIHFPNWGHELKKYELVPLDELKERIGFCTNQFWRNEIWLSYPEHRLCSAIDLLLLTRKISQALCWTANWSLLASLLTESNQAADGVVHFLELLRSVPTGCCVLVVRLQRVDRFLLIEPCRGYGHADGFYLLINDYEDLTDPIAQIKLQLGGSAHPDEVF